MQKSRKLDKIYTKTAKEHNVPASKMTSEMQKSIDIGWNNPDPSVKAKWNKLFPNGKPTVDEFISATSNEIKNKISL